ncbi:hypothetical protein GCM10023195_28410 [Actinoallomurus liliacearum]|uniref:Uncharacterized protein n=1 Tax=Actinoallomurus liliacearum TaxID=1080073 RepID=A0ABP8TIP1_9ACTN
MAAGGARRLVRSLAELVGQLTMNCDEFASLSGPGSPSEAALRLLGSATAPVAQRATATAPL